EDAFAATIAARRPAMSPQGTLTVAWPGLTTNTRATTVRSEPIRTAGGRFAAARASTSHTVRTMPASLVAGLSPTRTTYERAFFRILVESAYRTRTLPSGAYLGGPGSLSFATDAGAAYQGSAGSPAVQPPSTGSTTPVTALACGAARKTIAPAISRAS